jgi:threonine dehydratase
MNTETLTASAVALAAERISPYARRTPLIEVESGGRRLLLKLEHMQLGGSFKLRGALNALLSGPLDEHVVTASGGNHGLAVATAARLLGVEATVYVPESAPASKARRIEAAGARLVRYGASFAEAAAAASDAASRPGLRFLHAYDDPAVVAGQGTVAAEIVADAPHADTLVVAVGGGGLAAGTTLAGGGRRVVAVEPEHCRCLHDALAAGKPVDSAIDSVAASATGASRVGEVPWAILSAAAARRDELVSVLVDDEQIVRARDRLWEECRIAVEPAAAAPFAAWLAGLVPGDAPCLVVCGANADWTPASP